MYKRQVIEYVKGIEVIKAFNMEDSSYAKYKNAVIRHAEYAINWMKSSQIYASLSYSICLLYTSTIYETLEKADRNIVLS